LLTQEAEYFRIPLLREQAIALLQTCTEKADVGYVNEVLVKSISCPMGFDKKAVDDDDDDIIDDNSTCL
jgi:hypothetical protein